MSLLDLFLPAKKSDVVFGDLVYRRGAWNGAVSIPELHDHSIPLEIQTGKHSDLSAFRPVLNRLSQNIDKIKEQIAEEAFKTYEMYVREDRKAGNFTDAEYARYPAVTSAADIWGVLTPFGLTITASSKSYDAIIWLDVYWPNPHYFVAYLNDATLYVLDVDG